MKCDMFTARRATHRLRWSGSVMARSRAPVPKETRRIVAATTDDGRSLGILFVRIIIYVVNTVYVYMAIL